MIQGILYANQGKAVQVTLRSGARFAGVLEKVDLDHFKLKHTFITTHVNQRKEVHFGVRDLESVEINVD